MKKTLFVLLAAACSVFSAFANYKNVVSTPIIGAAIVQNATTTISGGPPIAGFNSSCHFKNTITLEIDQNLKINGYVSFAYTLELLVEITGNDLKGSTIPIQTRNLKIKFNPFENEVNSDKVMELVSDNKNEYFNMQLKVLNVTFLDANGSPFPSTIKIPENVILKINRESYIFYQIPATSVSVNTINFIDLNHDLINDEVELSWIPAANIYEEYELEWTSLSDLTALSGAYLSPSLLAFNFKNNSTRIRTSDNSYKLNIAFEHGYVAYRVRPIGRKVESINGDYIVDENTETFGAWSAPDNGILSTLSSNAFVVIGKSNNSIHDDDKNWQYSATYAEDGKRSEAICYLDGSFHKRQNVTRSNTNGNAVVGETVYDHVGRPAVNIMPAPVVNSQNNNQTPLQYYNQLNMANGNIPFNFTQIDAEANNASNCPTPLILPPLSNNPTSNGSASLTNGSSNYFSDQNALATSGNYSYIPDAAGYPMSQIEYTPDNTGRIRNKGGVGKSFQIGSDHESKFYYGKPFQVELDRLFGSEVGIANHYKKNIVIDPNGQISISYLDLNGKVIATALAGNSPNQMNALPSAANAEKQIIVDLLDKDTKGMSNVNKPDNNNTSISFVSEYLAANTGNHAFQYGFTAPVFSDTCFVNQFCFDCVYNLTIDVRDECGNKPVMYSGNISNKPDQANPIILNPLESKLIGRFSKNQEGKIMFNIQCNNATIPVEYDEFILQIEKPGNYKIVKTLTINHDAESQYLQQYLDNTINQCIIPLQSFINEEESLTNKNGCGITCEQCYAALGTRENWIKNGLGSFEEYDKALSECDELCKSEKSICESAYLMMLSDVSPGGQYAQYLSEERDIDPSRYPLSLLNSSNKMPLGGAVRSWKHPVIFINGQRVNHYFDEDGSVSKIKLQRNNNGEFEPQIDGVSFVSEGNNYILPEGLKNVNDFIKYWEPSWAKSLIAHHPEYCYYKECVELNKQTDNDKWDIDFMATTSYPDAQAKGYLDPLGTKPGQVVIDPFFKSSLGSIFKTEAQISYTHAYQNNTGIIFDMLELATKYTLAPNDPTAAIMSIASASVDEQDLIWQRFKGLYMALKQKSINKFLEEKVFNCSLSNTGIPCNVTPCGLNGCIGNDNFNPFTSKMFVKSNGDFKFLEMNQPCNIATYNLYRNKDRRFNQTNTGQISSKEDAEYQHYIKTGQCPLAFYLEQFLGGLSLGGNLTHNYDLFKEPTFIRDIYLAVSKNTVNDNYLWQIQSISNFQVTANFYNTQSNTVTCNITLTKKDNSFSWDELVNVTELTFQSFDAGVNNFSAIGWVIKDSKMIRKTINGSTCMNITGCSFQPKCKLRSISMESISLLNALSAENNLYAGNIIAGNSSPLLTGTISDALLKYFGLNENQKSLILISVSNVGIILSGNGKVLKINTSPALPINGNIYSEFEPNGANLIQFHNRMNPFDIYYFGLYDASNQLIETSECEMPASQECDTREHRNYKALKLVLNDIVTDLKTPNNSASSSGIQNAFNLSFDNHFNLQLKSYLGFASTYKIKNFCNTSFESNSHEGEIVDAITGEIACRIKLLDLDVAISEFNYVSSFSVDHSIETEGKYYHFLISINTSKGEKTYKGYTTCFPLEECADCKMRIEKTDCYSLYQKYVDAVIAFNSKNSSTLGNHVEGILEPISYESFDTSGFCNQSIASKMILENYLSHLLLYNSNTSMIYPTRLDLINSSYYSSHQTFFNTYLKNDLLPYLLNKYNLSVSGPYTDDMLLNYSLYLSIFDNNNEGGQPKDIATYLSDSGLNKGPEQNEPCYQNYLKYYATVMAFNEYIQKDASQNAFPIYDYSTFKSLNLCNCADGYSSYLKLKLPFNIDNGGGINVDLGFAPDVDTTGKTTEIMIKLPPSDEKTVEILQWSDKMHCRIPCVPNSPEPQLASPTTEPKDNCDTHLSAIARHNALRRYDDELARLTADFIKNYRNKCMSVSENFTMSYKLKDYHYTLYYYDQAGNLIRTIPPEGVAIMDIYSPTCPLGMKIKSDRENKTHFTTTEHTLASTYQYNSLNQLVKQSIPDHDKMDWIEMNVASGLPAHFTVTGIHFTTPSKGFLTGFESIGSLERGRMFTTENAGCTWISVDKLSAVNFKKLVMTSSNNGWAIGNEGNILRTTDGGENWDIVTYSNATLQAVNFNDIYITEVSPGFAVGNNGTIVEITFNNNTSSFIKISSSAIPTNANINAINFNNSTFIIAIEEGAGQSQGALYAGSALSNLSRIDKIRARNFRSIHFLHNNINKGWASGDNGTLYATSDAGITWSEIDCRSMISFDQLYFYSELKAIAHGTDNHVYHSINGGKTWALVTTALIYYIDFNGGDDYGFVTGKLDNHGFIASVIFTNMGTAMNPISYRPSESILASSHSSSANLTVLLSDGHFFVTYNANIPPNSSGVAPIWTGTNQLPSSFDITAGIKQMKGELVLTISGKFSFNQNISEVSGFYADNNSVNYTYGTSPNYKVVSVNTMNNLSVSYNQNIPSTVSAVAYTGNAVFYVCSDGGIFKDASGTLSEYSDNIIPLPLKSMASNGPNIYATGNNGNLLKISSSNNTFRALKQSKITVEDISTISFGANNKAVLAGTSGFVGILEDGPTSATITQIETGSNESFNASLIYGTSAEHAALASDNGNIVSINNIFNASRTNTKKSITNKRLNAISQIPGTSLLLVAGDEATIIAYDFIISNISPNAHVHSQKLNALHFANTSFGVVVGKSGFIHVTSDGGLTWKAIVNKSFADLKSVFCISEKTAYIGGVNFFQKLTDGATLGNNIIGTETVNGINFSSANEGYIVTAWGNIYKYNGSWSLLSSTGVSLNAIFQVNPACLYIPASNGKIYKIINGQFNLTTQPPYLVNTGTVLNALYFFDPKTGYAVGNSGAIYKISDINIPGTTLISRTFTKSSALLNSQNNYYAISFVSRNQGFLGGGILGGNARVAYTINDEADMFSNLFWYDKLGRLTLSQNTKQLHAVQANSPSTFCSYSYTRFDPLGRVVETGELSIDINANGTPASLYLDGKMDEELLNQWLLGGTRSQVTRTYYDAPFGTGLLLSNGKPFVQTNMRNRVSAITYAASPTSAPLADNDFDYASYFAYDIHGNVHTLVNDYQKPAQANTQMQNQRYKTLQYTYDLISGKVNSVSYQDGSPDAFYHRYLYDADNRLQQVQTSRDQLLWNNDARYYYYLHGPLSRTELGDSKVQGIDYAYTLQGWIKGVNSASLQPGRDMGKDGSPGNAIARDAFGYTLGYFNDDGAAAGHQSDYTPINTAYDKNINSNTAFEPMAAPGSDMRSQSHDLYNGNIMDMVTAITRPTNYTSAATAQTQDILPQGTAYTYDQLNRLIDQRAFTNLSNNNTWQASGIYNNHYFMHLSYDANGNIEHLDRYAAATTGSAAPQIDNLDYRYDTRDRMFTKKDYGGPPSTEKKKFSNRLYHVNDAIAANAASDDIDDEGIFTPAASGNAPAGNYGYDESGNLIRDLSEQIAEIAWNTSGKMLSIKRTGNSTRPNLRFDYDASGNRVAKYVYTNIASQPFDKLEKVTYFVRDAQGNVMATYEETFANGNQNDILYICTEHHLYGNARIGMNKTNQTLISPSGYGSFSFASVTRTLSHKFYEGVNHLGNVLSVFTDRKIAISTNGTDISYYVPEVTTSTDYYAFGMPLPGRTFEARNYRYGYNGQEKDDEVAGDGNINTAEFWEFDTRLGRRWNVDPILKAFESPYACFANSPLILVDIKGKDWFSYKAAGDDEVKWHWQKGNKYKLVIGNDANGNQITQTLKGEKAVIEFKGSRLETLNPDGTIRTASNNQGSSADLYRVNATVILHDAHGETHEYTGWSMTSDNYKYTAIDEGFYNVSLLSYSRKVSCSNGGEIDQHWAVNDGGRVRTIDGQQNFNALNQEDPNTCEGYKLGILIHCVCANNRANGNISTGCLLISDGDWADFDTRLSFNNKAKLVLSRAGSNHNPTLSGPTQASKQIKDPTNPFSTITVPCIAKQEFLGPVN